MTKLKNKHGKVYSNWVHMLQTCFSSFCIPHSPWWVTSFTVGTVCWCRINRITHYTET